MAEEFPYPLFVEGKWDPKTPKLKNKLTIYFQSKKSNGGDCTVQHLEGQKATVGFKTEEVRRSVLDKQTHEIRLGEHRVSLNVYLSPEAAEESRSPVKADQTALRSQGQPPAKHEKSPATEPQSKAAVVLENLQNIRQDILVMLVENVLNEASESKDFSIEVIPESSCAVITFTSRKVAESFILSCPAHSIFRKNNLAVRPLEKTTKVKAEDIPSNFNSDYTFLYFEKFGEIEGDVEMLKGGHSAIITFKDHTALTRVLSKQHQMNKQPIKVFPYYESLGTALYGKDRPTLRLPETFTKAIDRSVGKYLQDNPGSLDPIKQAMEKHFCKLDLQDGSVKISPLASLLHQGSQTRTLIQIWREKASAAFTTAMAKYTSLEINVQRVAWSEMEAEIHTTMMAKSVTLLLRKDRGTMILAGFTDDVQRTGDNVQNVLNRITERIQREKGSVADEIAMVPSIYEIIMLDGLKQEIHSSFPEMQLSYHSQSKKLALYGLKQEALESKNKILQEVIGLKRKIVELHPSSLEFLSKRDQEELISDLFLSKGIKASLEIKGNQALLVAKTEKTLKDSEEHLKAALDHECLDIEDPSVLRKAEWQNLLTYLNDAFNSTARTVIINTSESQVRVSGFTDTVYLVMEQVSDFVENNSNMVTTIEADRIVLRFIKEHKKQDWFETVKNKVNVDFKDGKIVLSGPKVHVSVCKPVFENLCSSVYHSNLKVAKPGAKKFFKSKESMYVTAARETTGCLVELVDENEVLQAGGVSVGKEGVLTPEAAATSLNEDQQNNWKSNVMNAACFSICGPSKAAVDQAKQWIEKLISDEQVFESFKDSLILSLSETDLQQIFKLEQSMDVIVIMEGSTILVEGLSRDVLMAVSEIQSILRRMRDNEGLRKDMELTYEMCEVEEYPQGGLYQSFSTLTNLQLEQAFAHKSPHVDMFLECQPYKVTMPEGPAVGTVDSKWKNIRHTDKTPVLVDESLPREWETMAVTDLYKEFPLQTNSTEYMDVLSHFRKTCPRNNVLKITRIQNPGMWKKYQNNKHIMEIQNNHKNNERRLFHGTRENTMKHINHSGFNRSYAGRNAAYYGKGTYFALNASYSAQATYSVPNAQGQKHMYFCRVLTGDYTVGNHTMIVPPPKSANGIELYDTVVDNAGAPTIFVVFRDDYAYPEYLITFT